MAAASPGVKPDTRRLQSVIRKTFEDLFSRFISWRGAFHAHPRPSLRSLSIAHPRPRLGRFISRTRAPDLVAFYRAPAHPPRLLSIAHPRPRLGRFLSRTRAPTSIALYRAPVACRRLPCFCPSPCFFRRRLPCFRRRLPSRGVLPPFALLFSAVACPFEIKTKMLCARAR
jgi:hypothetical protein